MYLNLCRVGISDWWQLPVRCHNGFMKVCVIGAPSTGKSVFAKMLAAEMSKRGRSCELVQEYASQYIQQTGAPAEPWEQLVISVGQRLIEEAQISRENIVTDAAAFATYIYAQRSLPQEVPLELWPKYRHLLDVLRTLARQSVASYDLIFLLSHVFPPRADGVRLNAHLSRETCQDINRDLESFLKSERAEYYRIKANESNSLEKTLQVIEQRLMVHELAK